MKFRNNQPPPAGFQLAPMIDVVFLLLIFFIVTFQLTDQEKVLEVNVPTAEEGVTKTRAHLEIIVNVKEDGEIIIEKQDYTLPQLQEKMERLARVNKDQPIKIRGDAKTDYQSIVQVIDHCRKAGIWNISFATQAPK